MLNCNLGCDLGYALRVLATPLLVASGIGAYAAPFPGFILSPSDTLRVAGLALWVKVEHPTV